MKFAVMVFVPEEQEGYGKSRGENRCCFRYFPVWLLTGGFGASVCVDVVDFVFRFRDSMGGYPDDAGY